MHMCDHVYTCVCVWVCALVCVCVCVCVCANVCAVCAVGKIAAGHWSFSDHFE